MTPPLDNSVITNLVSHAEWEVQPPLATPSVAGTHKSGTSTSVEKDAELAAGAGHAEDYMESDENKNDTAAQSGTSPTCKEGDHPYHINKPVLYRGHSSPPPTPTCCTEPGHA